MKLPKEIGPIHFVGIGGIGMSGIAEVLINLGHTVQGSDASDNANVKRLRERGAKVFVGHDAGQPRFGGGRGRLDRDPARQSGAGRGAGAPHSGRPPRRNARRAHAPQAMRRRRRHARQDDDHRAGGDPARRGRTRSDRDQRRHHQRLWRQRPARGGRLDGGRGRRERRHFPEAAGRHRHRHQRRSGASRPFQDLRRDQGRLSGADREPAVLRLRRDVSRSSDRAGAGRADRGPARPDLRRESAGRHQAPRRRHGGRRHPILRSDPRPCDRPRHLYRRSRAADAGPAQRAERHRGDRGRASSSALRSTSSARRSAPSAASSGASPAPGHGTGSRSTTTTATIRSRSPPSSRRRARPPAAR